VSFLTHSADCQLKFYPATRSWGAGGGNDGSSSPGRAHLPSSNPSDTHKFPANPGARALTLRILLVALQPHWRKVAVCKVNWKWNGCERLGDRKGEAERSLGRPEK